MADLKAGTTVGGELVWHQGNFPLFPAGDQLLYKTYKVYTEFNKPQAIDNDFVSKATGGTYLAEVTFDLGINFKDKNGFVVKLGKSDNASMAARLRVKDTFAIETETGQPFIQFNPLSDMSKPRLVVMGDSLARYVYDESGRVFSPSNVPTLLQIGLDKVDNAKQVQLNNINLQTMTGSLKAPNFFTNAATSGDQVPRFDQTVPRNSIQDFGTY